MISNFIPVILITSDKIARLISIILGPQVWFPLLIIILLFITGLIKSQQLTLTPLLIIFFILIPFSYVYLMIKQKKIADWDIRNRKERYKVLPVFILSTLVLLVLTYYLGTPLFFHLFIILWILALIGTLITYLWKISLHMILNTTAVIIVNFIFDWKLPMLYILIPIAGWARYYRKHHTINQILIGILVSVFVTLITFIYFGYI